LVSTADPSALEHIKAILFVYELVPSIALSGELVKLYAVDVTITSARLEMQDLTWSTIVCMAIVGRLTMSP
jgi:hypothetical protein